MDQRKVTLEERTMTDEEIARGEDGLSAVQGRIHLPVRVHPYAYYLDKLYPFFSKFRS